MIVHVVALTWNGQVDDAWLRGLCEALGDLPTRIPSIVSYRFGPDLGVSNGNANFGIAATFEDLDGLHAYRQHPAHQAVVQRHIAPRLASHSAVQFAVFSDV